METKNRGKAHEVFGSVMSDVKTAGKKSLEWDLNDWKWDGDLFVASPFKSVPFDSRNRHFFPVAPELPSNVGFEDDSVRNENGKRELEKRRVVVIEDEELNNDEVGSLDLKLGGQVYPIMDEDGKSGKKTKVVGTSSNRAVCQVENCGADLINAKDYHRRHKVCEVHSKATKALVGNVMQRFCQQCSRFHVLQEFDEGKRSCRRRLAGHNKRRRKTHPDNMVNGGSQNDEKGCSDLLISLLRILSNVHSNSSVQTKDQDLIPDLFNNLARMVGTNDGRNISGLLQGSKDLLNTGTSVMNVEKVLDAVAAIPQPAGPSNLTYKIDKFGGATDHETSTSQHCVVPAVDLIQKRMLIDNGHCPSVSASQFTENQIETTFRGTKMNNIDLNNVYDGSQDHEEKLERPHAVMTSENGSLYCHSMLQTYSHKCSPPQTSGNSDSTSTLSPSSSSGEAQSRTDRIVFKLFGKDPSDFPIIVRRQILDWLSHSPTDIESYIRPGCIILTIYLRLGKQTWEELCYDLGSSLRRLLDCSGDPFWRTGWLYARVQHSVAFMYNGQVVLDTPLPLKSHKHCRITSIKPVAVSASECTKFIIKGFNLMQSTMRLLCALEGKYLAEEMLQDLTDGIMEHDKLQSLSFQCSIPDVSGRGFIEVEDHGLSCSFFPFIVVEEEVCLEICTLESAIETAHIAVNFQDKDKMIEVNQAHDFLHEMGWLLHLSRVKFRLGDLNPNCHGFAFNRFRWLMEFSMEHDWCAVVKKLLSILFDGTIDTGSHASIELALSDMSLLHKAVKRNCRPMVELLLKYALDKPGREQKDQLKDDIVVFRPDDVVPSGLTPLHVAASMDNAENVLDALTDDPGMVGIAAWKSARDNTGLSPNDYACLQGRHSYISLVQRKLNKKSSETTYVAVDIPSSSFSDSNSRQKSFRVVSLETEKETMQTHCRQCQQKLLYGNTKTSLVYRPAMLSMVAIAAVCVCVALLFKSSPEVLYIFRPFRWELLKYGSS